MSRTYVDFMNEITPDELYDRLIQYGLFSEKLPSVFDASTFLAFCKTPGRTPFSDKWYPYASYNSMRNINIPRPIGIPTPMGYERLCACLKDHWPLIQKHFINTTSTQTHIVSRIHIRKMHNTDALFEMNYKDWKADGTPEPDLLIGKKYMVCADISKCFPSIYTHAIPWALVGKTTAKQYSKNKSAWYNQIDHFAQISKNGETHGLLIGPHTSNLLSEIILCKIDEALNQKWDYIRNIDDYCCYVKSRDEADDFLVDLNRCLREYDLSLNHKKTEILELPVGAVERWVRQLKNKSVYFGKFKPYVDYKEVQSFLDFSIELVTQSRENASIIFYALKTLKDFTLTPNAKQYLAKTVISLALIYPYIVPLLGEFLFDKYNVSPSLVEHSVNLIYDTYLPKRYNDACAHALFYAVKYNVIIKNFSVEAVPLANDCILSLMALIYARHIHDTIALKKLKEYAKKLKAASEFEENWPFTYECLTVGLLGDDWKKMKQADVSFLKKIYR